jgi:hypothetical protein
VLFPCFLFAQGVDIRGVVSDNSTGERIPFAVFQTLLKAKPLSGFFKFIPLVLIFILGCDQSFNPKAPFEQQMVVFSILSNARDTQYVRVSTNYDVSGFDASEHQIDGAVVGARVSVTGPTRSYDFSDVVLPREDTNRYKSPIRAYAGSPFRPEHAKTYALGVTSETYGTARATVTLPDEPMMTFGLGTYILDHPDTKDPNNTIYFTALLTSHTKGYLTQLFVDYQVLNGTEWQEKRIEVPMKVLTDTLSIWDGMYPEMRRLMISQTSTPYEVNAYVKVLLRVLNQHPNQKIIFERVVGRVLQCETGLYDYYSTVNAFRDPISVRLDEPDYSNLSGAKGVFGGYALDSLVHLLPENFGFNSR